jgi:hypothetical protein
MRWITMSLHQTFGIGEILLVSASPAIRLGLRQM